MIFYNESLNRRTGLYCNKTYTAVIVFTFYDFFGGLGP